MLKLLCTLIENYKTHAGARSLDTHSQDNFFFNLIEENFKFQRVNFILRISKELSLHILYLLFFNKKPAN